MARALGRRKALYPCLRTRVEATGLPCSLFCRHTLVEDRRRRQLFLLGLGFSLHSFGRDIPL